jgi:hypothetical protein
MTMENSTGSSRSGVADSFMNFLALWSSWDASFLVRAIGPSAFRGKDHIE